MEVVAPACSIAIVLVFSYSYLLLAGTNVHLERGFEDEKTRTRYEYDEMPGLYSWVRDSCRDPLVANAAPTIFGRTSFRTVDQLPKIIGAALQLCLFAVSGNGGRYGFWREHGKSNVLFDATDDKLNLEYNQNDQKPA